MANSQAILQAIAGMQQNTQESLPVIPNNGNPGGVHNMPQQPQAAPAAAPAAPVDKYPWLKPSASVANIRALSQRGMAPTPVATPVPQQTMGAPVLPQRGLNQWNGM